MCCGRTTPPAPRATTPAGTPAPTWTITYPDDRADRVVTNEIAAKLAVAVNAGAAYRLNEPTPTD